MTAEDRAESLIQRLHRVLDYGEVGPHHRVAFHGELPWDGDVVIRAEAVAWLDELLLAGGMGITDAEAEERHR